VLNTQEKETCVFLGRQFIYFLFLMICAVGLWYGAKIQHSALFEEYELVENLEVFLMLFTAFIFGIWAVLFPKQRTLSFFLTMLPLAAAGRELDAFFDNLIPVIGWKFIWFFPLIGLIYALFHFQDFRKSLIKFINSPSFYLMLSAMIIIVPIAQTIGHKSFIIDVIGETSHARQIRRLFEESIELEGYLLILLSAFEYYFSQLRSKNK